MRHKFLKVAALLVTSVFAMNVGAQTNIIANWDGGSSTGKPTEYGWASSNSSRNWGTLNGSGARMNDNYSGYKLENGTAYSYAADSELSSKILWIRYNATSEIYTYTFKGLEAGRSYTFSGLVGWHNNSNAPTFTISVNGDTELAKVSKYCGNKQTMYPFSVDFMVPANNQSTNFTLTFKSNQGGDCMEALSALSIVENKEAYKTRLSVLIAQAESTNAKIQGLGDAITSAKTALEDENADLLQAIIALQTAIDNKLAATQFRAEGDDVTCLFLNTGFDEDINFDITSSANTESATNYPTLGWTPAVGASSTGAIIGYGFEGQLNGGNATAPETNSKGTAEGGALFICVGWSGTVVYKSLLSTLPAGAYTISYTAYNGNTKNTEALEIIPLVGFVPENGEPLISNTTESFANQEWVNKSYTFVLAEATKGEIQIGMKPTTNTNSYNAPELFIDDIVLTYCDLLTIAKINWQEAKTQAETVYASEEYQIVVGKERSTLKAEYEKSQPTTVEDCENAIQALNDAINAFKAAKKHYDALAKNIAVAKSLGMAEATANGYAATATSTAAEALANTNNLKVAEYALIKGTYDQNVNLNKWTENFAEDLNDEGYKADGETYFNEWNGGNVTRTAKQTVKLPAGDYAISCIARGPEGTSGFLYYKAGENCDTTNFYMKGNRGLGVDTEGNANFTPATEENGITYNYKENENEGYGWEYYFLSLHLDKETDVEIGISASFSNAWVSMYAPQVRTTEASIKAVHLTTIASLLAEVPTGTMNAAIKSNLDAKVTAAKAATDKNTIDELATISSELRDAVVEAKPSAEAYIKLNDYITRAKAFDATAVAPYEAKYNNGEYVNDDVVTVQQELNVISYNVVANSFANSVELGEWTKEGDTGSNNNQHWSGQTSTYLEQSGAAWGANTWKLKYEQQVALPAGDYILKVAGRKSAAATMELVVSMGETVLGTVNDFPNSGDTGLGINKDGVASFDANDEKGFTNDGKGRGWQWRFVKFTLAAKDTVKIAVNANAESINQWISFCDYTLQVDDATYKAVYTPIYNAYLDEAKALNAMAMGNEEKAALEKVINENQTVPTTPATLKAQSDALKAAIETAKPSADAYAWIYNSIENAKTFGIEVAGYEAIYASRAYTIAQADTVHQELNVATYNKVATDYTNEYALTDWSTDELKTEKGQHWSGHKDTEYYDTNGSNFTRSTVKTVTLPKGSFVLKAAGRSSTAAKLTLDVNGTMVEFHAKGDVGYGIDTLGVANFSKKGIYANDNKGRGWEWQFVKFSLDEQTEVTLKATISAGKDWAWGSMGDVSLWMDDATFEGMLIAAKSELTAEIANAEALSTANVGDGAFQILSTDANLKTLKNAIATAKMLCESDLATTDMVLAGIPTLKQAEETYKTTISTAKLNAPAAGKKFNLVLTFKGWDYDGKAMTYIANDRSDAGKYNIKYAAAPNASYAQAFTFTPAESATNGYYLSMTDVDGNERYISTGVQYGGQAAQIRTTTDATKALIVQVRATATEGVYNLWNTEAKNYIGSQDAGVFTVNSHIDFKLVAAEEAEVTVDITIGYATLMLPFNAELPAGMKAYTCVANADEAILTLTEVETLVANTPYLVEGEGSFEFNGYGLAAKDSYTSASLTGTYTEIAAPVDSYVLQQLDGYTAFYRVAEGKQPKVGANRCYLTVPAGTAKAPMFSISRGEDTTGIENSTLNAQPSTVIYDLMGRKVTNMVKGNMYIVNGKKVVIK